MTITGVLEKEFNLHQHMFTIRLKEYPGLDIVAPEGRLDVLAWMIAADQGKKVQITYEIRKGSPDSKPVNMLVSGRILE